MKILAVDTATKTCSVAIIDDHSLLAELTVNHGQTHAKFLMGVIHSLFESIHLSLRDIDGFAVTVGPGSFTGLRIGLSSIKGLCMATGKPVIGVSTLDVLVYPFAFTSKCICPMIDARKGQVYTARYRYINGDLIEEASARSLKPNHAIDTINEPCIFVGDGAELYKDVIKHHVGNLANFAPSYQNIINASVVAQLSLSRFLNNDTDDVRHLIPLYIRQSEAEINRFQV